MIVKNLMKRFLDSLKVHVDESVNDHKLVTQQFNDINVQWKTLSKTVDRSINESLRPKKKRSHSVANKHTNVYNQWLQYEQEAQKPKPKYTPASQYPVPMQPRVFKPVVNSFNAERVAKLATMRPIQVRAETPPEIPDDSAKVPKIDVECLAKKLNE